MRHRGTTLFPSTPRASPRGRDPRASRPGGGRHRRDLGVAACRRRGLLLASPSGPAAPALATPPRDVPGGERLQAPARRPPSCTRTSRAAPAWRAAPRTARASPCTSTSSSADHRRDVAQGAATGGRPGPSAPRGKPGDPLSPQRGIKGMGPGHSGLIVPPGAYGSDQAKVPQRHAHRRRASASRRARRRPTEAPKRIDFTSYVVDE